LNPNYSNKSQTEYYSFKDWAHSPAANLITWYALFGIIVTTVIYFGTGIVERNQNVYTSDLISSTKSRFISEPFTINGHGNVVADISSDVDNAYLDVELRLISPERRIAYVTHDTIEYYHGYESGSYWTEGGKHGSIYFSRIPPGIYILEILPVSNNTETSFQISAFRDKRHTTYYFLLLAWFLVWFILILLAKTK
jgi:hypothetical protein